MDYRSEKNYFNWVTNSRGKFKNLKLLNWKNHRKPLFFIIKEPEWDLPLIQQSIELGKINIFWHELIFPHFFISKSIWTIKIFKDQFMRFQQIKFVKINLFYIVYLNLIESMQWRRLSGAIKVRKLNFTQTDWPMASGQQLNTVPSWTPNPNFVTLYPKLSKNVETPSFFTKSHF